MTTETVEFKTAEEAIAHITSLEEAATAAVAKYQDAVRQFTGIQPGRALNPMDIVRIVRKMENPAND